MDKEPLVRPHGGRAELDDLRVHAPQNGLGTSEQVIGDRDASASGQALAQYLPVGLPTPNEHADLRMIMY
jgi:hypothetical protein